MELTVINKRITLLKNIGVVALIFLNCFTLCLVGHCNEYNNESMVADTFENDNTNSNETNVNQTDMYNYYYNLYNKSTTSEVEDNEKEIEVKKVEITPAKAGKTSSQITSEVFTVYDLNTHCNVTLNGYDMVCQIVRNEVGAHYTCGKNKGQTAFDEDTLKAFAVAAYTYVKYNKNKGLTPSVGLNTDVSETLKSYVADVYGQAMYYDDSYICAVYCASTGGTTLSSEYNWGEAYPYLRSVESKYDSQGRQYKSSKTFSEEEIKNLVESRTNIKLSDNPENWFKISETVDGSYVNQLIIDGHSTCTINGKEKTITGPVFRKDVIGYSNLKSPDFTVEYSNEQFKFTAYGYGHGVGMPAEGAELYATIDGWNYKQILNHYYTGIEIK